jgi:N-acetylglucosamine-6-phosphate deacetylase
MDQNGTAMAEPTLIRNVRIVKPGEGVVLGDVLLADGRVAEVGAVSRAGAARAAVTVDGVGRLLTPGLVDMHTHGVLSHVYENGPDALRAGCAALGRFGVTTVVPTCVPNLAEGGTLDDWLTRIAAVAAAIPTVAGVHVPGLHLEGPFMAVCGAACATLPGDVALLQRILAACAGRLSIMSVSPETPGVLPVIKALVAAGVKVFLTHTRASAEDTQAALAAGAQHATHFYDVFHAPPEGDPGVRPVGAVEAVLADRRCTVDFIADGVHVHPAAIAAAVAAKGWAGVSLVTDSNVGVRTGAHAHNRVQHTRRP